VSHSEIENFLHDISFTNKSEVTKSETSSTSIAKEHCHEPWFDDEDSCTIDLLPISTKAVVKTKKLSTFEVCTEIQSIRDFCKVL